MKEMEEKIEEIIHKHEYWTMGAKESAKKITALVEPYQKLIEAQDKLIEVKEQKCEILADNKNSEVFKMIGLVRLNDELQDRIEQLKQQLK